MATHNLSNIMSYNATSLIHRNRRAEVNDFIKKQATDVILLQETRLDKKHRLFLSGMRVYRSDKGVGTAIGIKQNIKAERVTLSLLKVDHTATRNKSGRKGVLVVSVYVPCNTTKKELLKDLDKIMEHAQEYDSVILGGDWNAHHRVWEGDASKENRAVSAIVKFLYENTEVRIVNSKKPTFRRAATIDFFIMSRNLLETGATIGVGPEMPDHSFLILRLSKVEVQVVEKKRTFVYKNMDW